MFLCHNTQKDAVNAVEQKQHLALSLSFFTFKMFGDGG